MKPFSLSISMKHHKQFGLAVLTVFCITLAGCRSSHDVNEVASKTASTPASSESETPSARSFKPHPAQEVYPAQFQATVYEIEAKPGYADACNAKDLEKHAKTADDLLKALSKAGTARILYRFDQPVNVISQKLMMGKSEPFVTGSRTSSSGQTVNSVTYHQTGAIVRLSAPSSGGKRPKVMVAVELSVVAAGGVDLVPGQKATSIRNVSTEHQAELEFGQPRVILAVDSTSTDQKQPPAIYVIRYQFSR